MSKRHAADQMVEDAKLGWAWRRCEAALPEGWWLRMTRNKAGALSVAAFHGMGGTSIVGRGPTPTAALEALAAKLEAR